MVLQVLKIQNGNSSKNNPQTTISKAVNDCTDEMVSQKSDS